VGFDVSAASVMHFSTNQSALSKQSRFEPRAEPENEEVRRDSKILRWKNFKEKSNVQRFRIHRRRMLKSSRSLLAESALGRFAEGQPSLGCLTIVAIQGCHQALTALDRSPAVRARFFLDDETAR
jgi:hypothetical protein